MYFCHFYTIFFKRLYKVFIVFIIFSYFSNLRSTKLYEEELPWKFAEIRV